MARRSKTANAALADLTRQAFAGGAWMDDAACLTYSRDLWYGHEHERLEAREQRIAEARRVCYSCPVRVECLEAAIANREPHGMWGGHTTTERRALVRFRATE
jgi:WhiB family redox-sensing transcriptional regulator